MPSYKAQVSPRHDLDGLVRLDGLAYRHGSRLATDGADLLTPAHRLHYALSNPGKLLAYVHLLRAVPVVEVTASPAPTGQALAVRLRRLSRRERGGFGVLTLPATPEEYLRGTSRQAVRTNIRRAERAGVTTAIVPPADREATLANFSEHASERSRPERPSDLHDPTSTWFAARCENRVLGLAMTLQDGPTALLRALLGPEDQERASDVRYLLHTAVVADLVAHGAQNLIIAGMASAPPGQKYFAARLGYTACRVQLITHAPAELVTASAAPEQGGQHLEALSGHIDEGDAPGASPRATGRESAGSGD